MVNASFWESASVGPIQVNCFGMGYSMGYSRKKNQRGEGGVEDIPFFKKKPWNCFGFSLCSWKFQVKQNSTPENLVNFKAKTQDHWKFHMSFSWSPMDIPSCF